MLHSYSTTSESGSQGILDFLHLLVARNLEGVLVANRPDPVKVVRRADALNEVCPEPEPVKLVCDTDTSHEVCPEPKPVKLSGSDVESLILACSERVKAMAWNFVRRSHASQVNFDDLYQAGMVAVCEAVPRLNRKPDLAHNPFPYLAKAAHYAMIDEYRRSSDDSSLLSLDAPFSDDSEMCLADVLAAPVPLATPVSSKKEQALHDAIERLSFRHQEVVRRRFGFSGYGVHSVGEVASYLHSSRDTATGVDGYVRHKLACDPGLRAALGVEVEHA